MGLLMREQWRRRGKKENNVLSGVTYAKLEVGIDSYRFVGAYIWVFLEESEKLSGRLLA